LLLFLLGSASHDRLPVVVQPEEVGVLEQVLSRV
jgi:hypothetical protein